MIVGAKVVKFVAKSLADLKRAVTNSSWYRNATNAVSNTANNVRNAVTNQPQFLSQPATQNGTLVIGAGKKPHPGAYNIDTTPRAPGVHRGDATNLSNIRTGSQSRIIIENPHGFDPLHPEIQRVLAPGGRIEITGGVNNTEFFQSAIDRAPQLGFSVERMPNVPNQSQFTYTGGGILSPNAEFFKRYILRRR